MNILIRMENNDQMNESNANNGDSIAINQLESHANNNESIANGIDVSPNANSDASNDSRL